MKKLSVLFLSVSLSFTLGCQENNKGKETSENKQEQSEKENKKEGTPDAVKKSFQTKYPGENDPDWTVDSNGNFESNFKIDGVNYRADFSPNGEWIETETSIDKKDLPDAIKNIIKSDYSDSEITEIEKVDHHSKGTFYDVEFKRDGKNKDVEFNATGKVLN